MTQLSARCGTPSGNSKLVCAGLLWAGKSETPGQIALHVSARPLERTLLAAPSKVRIESLPVDRLEDLLDPAGEPAIVAGFPVEVHLLKIGLLRFHQHVITDEGLILGGAKTQLVKGVGIDQTVEQV